MEEMKKHIKRGEIYWCNLDPTMGSEQKGTRPVLIIQNNLGNLKSSVTTILILTSSNVEKQKKFPTNVYVEKNMINGLDSDSVVITTQIRVIDIKKRLIKKIGFLERTYMNKVEKALKINLGMDCICPHCDSILYKKEKDCRCGLKLHNECEKCSQLLKLEWNNCPFCGTEVNT